MKPRLQFRQPTGWTVSQIPTPGGRYLKYRPPLASWQPSDPACTAQISRIAGASSSSGSDARGPAAPAAPVPASDEACPGASHAGCAVRDPSGQEEIRSYSDVESTHKRFRQDSNPQEPNMAHWRHRRTGLAVRRRRSCEPGRSERTDRRHTLSPCITG